MTYRGNSRKQAHQTGDKYSQTNGLESRRYHTIGKTGSGLNQRNREIQGSMNGGGLPSSHSMMADPLYKRSNYTSTTTDSFFYRTNGTSGRTRGEPERPRRPKSTERLVDDVDRNEYCDFRRERPRRREERSAVKSSRNGVAPSYGEAEKHRRPHSEDKMQELTNEMFYKVMTAMSEPKKEQRVEKRKDRHGRRPHSAPVLDIDHPAEENKKCSHRNRKPAPPPPAYQDPAVAPLPKYRPPPPVTTTSVLGVENNNKIILKVVSLTFFFDNSLYKIFIHENSFSIITGRAHQVSHGGASNEWNNTIRHLQRCSSAKREKTEMCECASGAEQSCGTTKRSVVTLHAHTRQQRQP